MKTREQLIDQIIELLSEGKAQPEVYINLVVEACEEIVENKEERNWEYSDPEMQGVFSIGKKEERKRILKNIKKLKSK